MCYTQGGALTAEGPQAPEDGPAGSGQEIRVGDTGRDHLRGAAVGAAVAAGLSAGKLSSATGITACPYMSGIVAALQRPCRADDDLRAARFNGRARRRRLDGEFRRGPAPGRHRLR
jgi:hypothetical protein